MLLKAVQECTLEAVTLIAQGKLSRASDLLVCLIRSLQERELELQLNPPLRPTHQTLQVQDLVFLPVSKECRVSAPEWDEEIFGPPFAFFSPLQGAVKGVLGECFVEQLSHPSFLIASTVNTGFVAAGAA